MKEIKSMSQVKNSKPRKKVLTGWAYAHARYLADTLCDPDTAKDLREAATFGIAELCTLLGIEKPTPAPTPRAWNTVRQAYISARRTVEELSEKRGAKTLATIIQNLTLEECHTIPGLIFQVAEYLSELLHHLWCIDNSEGYAKNPNGTGYTNFALRRSPAYILRQLKDCQHTRHLIEEYGQGKVLEAVKAQSDLSVRAYREIKRAIDDRPLEDFIKGTHFRATLTPTINKR
jgi:hypothetical protein